MATKADPQVTAYVRARLLADTRSVREIGRELGVSHAAIADVRVGKAGVGPTLERAFAARYHGGSFDALHRAAAQHAREQPPALCQDLEAAIRYLDHYHLDTIIAARRAAEGGETHTPRGWGEWMDRYEAEAIRRGIVESGGAEETRPAAKKGPRARPRR